MGARVRRSSATSCAVDESGWRFVVEINEARGVPHDCAYGRAGIATYCPERLTFAIHDLPGGFAVARSRDCIQAVVEHAMAGGRADPPRPTDPPPTARA